MNKNFAAFQQQIAGRELDQGWWKLVDANSDGKVHTGFFHTKATAIVMKGRLEKAGCSGVELTEADHRPYDAEWEPSPFDVTGWCEKWTNWKEPSP